MITKNYYTNVQFKLNNSGKPFYCNTSACFIDIEPEPNDLLTRFIDSFLTDFCDRYHAEPIQDSRNDYDHCYTNTSNPWNFNDILLGPLELSAQTDDDQNSEVSAKKWKLLNGMWRTKYKLPQ